MKMNYANSAQQTTPVPTNPIPSALGQLGTAIHEMGVLSESLTHRLTGVMMPAEASKSDRAGLAGVDSVRSPTADEIHNFRRRVENITTQLQDVMNRLEV
jgi:hypothetical protein